MAIVIKAMRAAGKLSFVRALDSLRAAADGICWVDDVIVNFSNCAPAACFFKQFYSSDL